jgi:hypothetical protein
MTTDQRDEMRRDPMQPEYGLPMDWPPEPPPREAEGRDPEEVPPPTPADGEPPVERG